MINTNIETAGNDLSIIHDTFRRKKRCCFLVSSHTAVVASALSSGPQVTSYVLMWPTEQVEFETPGL